MNEEFVKSIYEEAVGNGLDIYLTLFNSISNMNDDSLIPYWKDSKEFYNSLSDKNKEYFFNILKQTMIETVTTVFGAIDGCVTLDKFNANIKLTLNGEDTQGELLDYFLAYIEDNELGPGYRK